MDNEPQSSIGTLDFGCFFLHTIWSSCSPIAQFFMWELTSGKGDLSRRKEDFTDSGVLSSTASHKVSKKDGVEQQALDFTHKRGELHCKVALFDE